MTYVIYQRCRKCRALHESSFTRVWCAKLTCNGTMTGEIPAKEISEREMAGCTNG